MPEAPELTIQHLVAAVAVPQRLRRTQPAWLTKALTEHVWGSWKGSCSFRCCKVFFGSGISELESERRPEKVLLNIRQSITIHLRWKISSRTKFPINGVFKNILI